MEDLGILDPDNVLHVTAIHVVFIPVLNQQLREWQEAWSFHRIRTVGRCPYEMFNFGPKEQNEELMRSIDVSDLVV